MTEPKWVTRQQVEFIHDAVIEMGGGSHGLLSRAAQNWTIRAV